MFCPHCGFKNTIEGDFCTKCGKALKNPRANTSKKTTILILSILISVVTLFGIGYLINNEFTQTKIILKEDKPTKDLSSNLNTPVQKVTEINSKTNNLNQVTDLPKKLEKETTEIIKESQSRVYTIITPKSLGSGFLFEEKGTVITNAHVVAGYDEVIVRNVHGQQTIGNIIGISNLYDIALIQVDEYAGQLPLKIETNESDIGMNVIALGSPLGLENSASPGYLTGINRSFESDFKYENVYQIDVQMSPGSSGGPLLDATTGKVIGINTFQLIADESIDFAIPMYSMIDLVNRWSDSPMTANEVVNVFSFYEDYAYDPELSERADSYYEEYENSEEYEQDSEEFYAFEDYLLNDFILYFRDNYELALDYEDFFYIEDMLLYDSNAYMEMAEYVSGIAGQGMAFNFTSNEITEITIEMDHAVVSTFETFDFMNAAGEWSIYERYKDYIVVMDEFGAYKISDIVIFD